MSLFMGLLPCCAEQERRLHVIHIDHGWRKESAAEAERLKNVVSSLGATVHWFRLSGGPEAGANLEDWGRRQRINCFRSVAQKVGSPYIFLGHQADDQVEVTVKRFLEGAFVTKLRGMRPVDEIDDLVMLRPLLSYHKSQLREWLDSQSIWYVEDPTNHDESFLRARMRCSLFPFLRRSFGKEFDKSILRVSQESALLEQFLEEERQQRFCTLGHQGVVFGFPKESSSSSPYFLVRSLLDEVLRKAGITLSRQQVLGATEIFCQRFSPVKKWQTGGSIVYAEARFFAAFRECPEPFPLIECIEEKGELYAGMWGVRWFPQEGASIHSSCWTTPFLGKKLSILIDKGPFTLCRANEQLLRKVPKGLRLLPTSLRPFVPLILQRRTLVADPFNGYTHSPELKKLCTEVVIWRR